MINHALETHGPLNNTHSFNRSSLKVRLGPDGILIFNRQTGMNVLLDEVFVPQAHWHRAPRFVSIALTNQCDLSCPYCYAPKDKTSLPPDRLLNWLTELDLAGCLGVGFGGGEPTLYKGFADLCREAAKRTSLAITFTTHGHRLNERVLQTLAGSVHFVRVSVDGIAETYEILRGRSFEALMAQMRALGKAIPFGINYVVNQETLSTLDEVAELATEMGAKELLLLPEHPTPQREGISTDTLASLRSWVRGYTGPTRLSMTEWASDGFPICATFTYDTGLRAYAHVDARGLVKRSSFDTSGYAIDSHGLMCALRQLENMRGANNEDLVRIRV